MTCEPRRWGYVWLCLAAAWPMSCTAQDALPLRAKAERLREALVEIDAAEAAGQKSGLNALYQRYFDELAGSFADWVELFGTYEELTASTAPLAYAAILEPNGSPERWQYGSAYFRRACEIYDHVDHRAYMEKVLRIGIEAGSWGGPDNERLYRAGDIYKSLVYGGQEGGCKPDSAETFAARTALIVEAASAFDDSTIERVYNSLRWSAEDTFPVNWLLDGLCALDSRRCALTAELRKRYLDDESSPP